METPAPPAARAGGSVLATLAAASFLMALDASVMNVSIATVAKDVGTTVTGIQTAITLYTLVMAMFMITGGKVGAIVGRRRAFAIGCVIYGAGSLTTAVAPTLGVLILGWSLLEGIGAALILPAVVALVAGNFAPTERPRAYGLVAAAGAIAIAVGPIVGGLVTTYASWRWVFAAEVVVVVGILALAQRLTDAPPERRVRLDVLGVVLSATGLGLFVFGLLRSGVWGWVQPKVGGPSVLGVSPVVVFVVGGIVVLWLFLLWEHRLEVRGGEPLVRPSMFGNRQMTGGLIMFFLQFLVQAGVFFTIPLFLSVVLGLSAIATGLRIMPLSITLLLAAVLIPRYLPTVSPRRIVRVGVIAILLGVVWLLLGLDVQASAKIVTVPMLLMGLGIGALASQLGAVTVSAVSEGESSEVGGLQNTATNMGASIGTALAGSILIAALSGSFLQGVIDDPRVPAEVKATASTKLASGVPFLSDADLTGALDDAGAGVELRAAILDVNRRARIDGLTSALFVLALLAVTALFATGRIPDRPVGAEGAPRPRGPTVAPG